MYFVRTISNNLVKCLDIYCILFIIATVQDNYSVIPVTDGGGIALFCHFMTIVYR